MLQRLYWSWLQKNEAAFTAGEGQRVFQTLHCADPCLGNGKPGPTRESAERRRAGRGRVRRPRFSFMLKLQRTTNVFVNKEQADPLT